MNNGGGGGGGEEEIGISSVDSNVWFESGSGCVMMIGQLSLMTEVKHAHIFITTLKCHQRQNKRQRQ